MNKSDKMEREVGSNNNIRFTGATYVPMHLKWRKYKFLCFSICKTVRRSNKINLELPTFQPRSCTLVLFCKVDENI